MACCSTTSKDEYFAYQENGEVTLRPIREFSNSVAKQFIPESEIYELTKSPPKENKISHISSTIYKSSTNPPAGKSTEGHSFSKPPVTPAKYDRINPFLASPSKSMRNSQSLENLKTKLSSYRREKDSVPIKNKRVLFSDKSSHLLNSPALDKTIPFNEKERKERQIEVFNNERGKSPAYTHFAELSPDNFLRYLKAEISKYVNFHGKNGGSSKVVLNLNKMNNKQKDVKALEIISSFLKNIETKEKVDKNSTTITFNTDEFIKIYPETDRMQATTDLQKTKRVHSPLKSNTSLEREYSNQLKTSPLKSPTRSLKERLAPPNSSGASKIVYKKLLSKSVILPNPGTEKPLHFGEHKMKVTKPGDYNLSKSTFFRTPIRNKDDLKESKIITKFSPGTFKVKSESLKKEIKSALEENLVVKSSGINKLSHDSATKYERNGREGSPILLNGDLFFAKPFALKNSSVINSANLNNSNDLFKSSASDYPQFSLGTPDISSKINQIQPFSSKSDQLDEPYFKIGSVNKNSIGQSNSYTMNASFETLGKKEENNPSKKIDYQPTNSDNYINKKEEGLNTNGFNFEKRASKTSDDGLTNKPINSFNYSYNLNFSHNYNDMKPSTSNGRIEPFSNSLLDNIPNQQRKSRESIENQASPIIKESLKNSESTLIHNPFDIWSDSSTNPDKKIDRASLKLMAPQIVVSKPPQTPKKMEVETGADKSRSQTSSAEDPQNESKIIGGIVETQLESLYEDVLKKASDSVYKGKGFNIIYIKDDEGNKEKNTSDPGINKLSQQMGKYTEDISRMSSDRKQLVGPKESDNSNTKENLSQRLSKRLSRISELTQHIQNEGQNKSYNKAEETVKRPIGEETFNSDFELRNNIGTGESTILSLNDIKKRASVSPNKIVGERSSIVNEGSGIVNKIEGSDITQNLTKRLSQISDKVDSFKRKSQVSESGKGSLILNEAPFHERNSMSQTLKSVLGGFEYGTLENISEKSLSDSTELENMKEKPSQKPLKNDDLSSRLSRIDQNIKRLSMKAEPIVHIYNKSSPKRGNNSKERHSEFSSSYLKTNPVTSASKRISADSTFI